MVRRSTSAANDAAQDLQSDMDDYRRRFGGVAFRDLAVSHPEYACVAKEFAVESLFHEYLTYVSPGRGRAERFSAALNTEAAASAAELEAYRAIVGSLVLLEVSGRSRRIIPRDTHPFGKSREATSATQPKPVVDAEPEREEQSGVDEPSDRKHRP